MAVIYNGEKPHISYERRRAAAGMSVGEIARRAGKSRNTIKAFLRGDKVRDTTVQSLMEALDSYEAERAEHTAPITQVVQPATFATIGQSLDGPGKLSHSLTLLSQARGLISEARVELAVAEQTADKAVVLELQQELTQIQSLMSLLQDDGAK